MRLRSGFGSHARPSRRHGRNAIDFRFPSELAMVSPEPRNPVDEGYGKGKRQSQRAENHARSFLEAGAPALLARQGTRRFGNNLATSLAMSAQCGSNGTGRKAVT